MGAILSKPPAGTRIDWSNPITRGLVLCVPFNEHAGTALDMARGLVFSPNGGAGWAATKDGAGARITAASSDYFASPACSDDGTTGDLSVMWRGSVASVGTYQHLMSKTASNGASSCPIDLRFNNSSPYSINSTRAGSNYSIYHAASQPVLTVGPIHTVVATFPYDDGSSDPQPVFYLDGLRLGAIEDRYGFSTITGAGVAWSIGRRPDGGEQLDGSVSVVAAWSRMLGDAEVYDLTANPWQLFRSSSPWYLIEHSLTAPPTTATLSLSASSGAYGSPVTVTATLDHAVISGTVSCPITSSNGNDTVTGSPISIGVGNTTGTCTVTPGGASGSRNITLGTTTPSLTIAGSPAAYNAVAATVVNTAGTETDATPGGRSCELSISLGRSQ